MALYIELDAISLNGEQYWYDQYTGLQFSSGVFSSTSTTLSGYERLLQFTAGLVEANSTLINHSNYISSSSVVPFAGI